MENCS